MTANGRFTLPIEITASDEWQNMTVTVSELRNQSGQELGDWSEAINIGFKPQDGSDITKVVFAQFKWVMPKQTQ